MSAVITIDDEDDEMQGAAALPVEETLQHFDEKLYYKLLEIFPNACRNYLKRRCGSLKYSLQILDFLTESILRDDYPKLQIQHEEMDTEDFDVKYETLKQILPDADPTYLEKKLQRYFNDPEGYKNFVTQCLEKRDYPTMKEYTRKRRQSSQIKQYTTDFNVEDFLKCIPSPEEYFSSDNRTIDLQRYENYYYVKNFLQNRYPYQSVLVINDVMKRSKSVWQMCQILDNKGKSLKQRRKPSSDMAATFIPIPLLQEICYLKHREEINEYIMQMKVKKEKQRNMAKKLKQLITCGCCFDSEVLPADSAQCENCCIFCANCVKTSVEIKFGEGSLYFPCLADCGSFFSLQTLQAVLEPKIFSKIALKKQVEEVKAAGIEDLEQCPFCDFVTIPSEGDKLFHCLNPDCMVESCRNCKEPSHIPLRCEEVEKDEDVKKRVYVENKMTEALLRNCYKCNTKFIKEEGCNKMTCKCGAMMCYICCKPVTDYKHFNGEGGDQYHLCPLFSNMSELHEKIVLEAASAAKAEIGNALKIDPSENTRNYYEELKKKTKKKEPHYYNNMVFNPPQPVRFAAPAPPRFP